MHNGTVVMQQHDRFQPTGFSGAPVINEAGRPVGVVSLSDIVVHDREKVEYLEPEPAYYQHHDLATRAGERLRSGFQVEKVDRTRVQDLMTPAVFCVSLDTPAASVVEQLRELNVHRLFVVDENGILVGVITALDVVRHLRATDEPR